MNFKRTILKIRIKWYEYHLHKLRGQTALANRRGFYEVARELEKQEDKMVKHITSLVNQF